MGTTGAAAAHAGIELGGTKILARLVGKVKMKSLISKNKK